VLDEGTFGELVVVANIVAGEDVRLFAEFTSKDASPQQRRHFVRAFVTTVEALAWTFKRLVLTRVEARQYDVTEAELAWLRERTFEMGEKGPREKTMYVPSRANVRFAVKHLAKAYGIALDLPTGDHEWESFRSTLARRNRLTHPKGIADLQISDDEAAEIAEAYRWFWKHAIGLLNELAEQHKNRWLPTTRT
jgi:hypothetical protein